MRLVVLLMLLALGGFVSIATMANVTTQKATEEKTSDPDSYDPLARARSSIGKIENVEATVPSQCYTKTAGVANPCWTCHTQPRGENYQYDWRLQEEYAFSEFAQTNHWSNLFVDRSAAIATMSDRDVLSYIRTDNYTSLREHLVGRTDYPGYIPDLDFSQGFDEEGFAADGSGWRAVRYKPFLGTFWPTNGSTDDVMIRLPPSFRMDSDGNLSRDVYKCNLAILEAAIAVAPSPARNNLDRVVEPVSEITAGTDLDGDGQLTPAATRIHNLPTHYCGMAKTVAVSRYRYPEGVEFLHTVRYIDPEHPTLLSTRMKEVRYAHKRMWLDDWALLRTYEKELLDKEEGKLPTFKGSPLVGLRNDFGWQLQGFIEDEHGRLRLQTEEEHYFCMGCHSSVGVTVDQTFAFARKVPGADGWRHQDLRGIQDVPQAEHPDPEILTYFRRVTGGDEFRANDEILSRFFPEGKLDETAVRRAAPGGDLDITSLITPSWQRALQLNKAYIALGGGRKQLTAIVIDRSGEPLHKSRDERRDHCVLASV
ncbi:MAG: hypothetical protein FJ147_12125 [Deltaproteobacteria bacterium]|nr:hypothetical protein [Deltaproteobacteria bacterium]